MPIWRICWAEAMTLTKMETVEVTQGRDAVVGLIIFMHHQAFDASPVVRALIVDDSHAALEADFVAAHTGEFAGIGPTGRQVSEPYAITWRWGRSLGNSRRGTNVPRRYDRRGANLLLAGL